MYHIVLCEFINDLLYACSAGIGRTGVLITMETAMCLIEANQPVYPLSIVRQMRDQRAMLIQTAVSINTEFCPLTDISAGHVNPNSCTRPVYEL